MKKVININLGGKSFTVNEDAYTKLDKYLRSIERHFAKSSGYEDILYDIENRIAELFEEDEKNGTIITNEKVEKIVSIMGKPEHFDDEFVDDEPETFSNPYIKTGKRLFRDPDDIVIGGVAAGLSSYFGIKDPIFLRIFFVILGFSGIGVLPYLILWIAVPSAKSSSDRLAMKGEDINIDSIAKKVEESILDLKDKLEDLGNDLKSKIL